MLLFEPGQVWKEAALRVNTMCDGFILNSIWKINI